MSKSDSESENASSEKKERLDSEAINVPNGPEQGRAGQGRANGGDGGEFAI